MSYKINKDNGIKNECNVLYNLLNPSKRAKSKINHYSPIQQGCMNTCSRREKFRNFQILLGSRNSSTNLMGKLTSELKQKQSETTTCEIQARKFTTSKKVNVYFCLPVFSATKIVSWKFQVDISTNGRSNMILGRDLLIALGLDLKFSENITIGG